MLKSIEQVNRQSAGVPTHLLDQLLGAARKESVNRKDSAKNRDVESISSNFKKLVQEKDKEAQKKELHKASQDLESMFVSMILKQMRSSIPKNSLTGNGREQEIYTTMFDEEIAKAISHGKGIGFASFIEKQLSKKAI